MLYACPVRGASCLTIRSISPTLVKTVSSQVRGRSRRPPNFVCGAPRRSRRSLSRGCSPPAWLGTSWVSQNACVLSVTTCPPVLQAAISSGRRWRLMPPSSRQRSWSSQQAELRRRAWPVRRGVDSTLVAKSRARSACRRAGAVPLLSDSFVAVAEIPFGPGGSHPLRRPDLDGCTDCEEAGRADASGVLAAIQIGAALHRPLSRI